MEARLLLAVTAVADNFTTQEDTPYVSSSGGLEFTSVWSFLDQIENQNGASDPYPVDGSGNAWNSPNFDIGSSTIGPWSTGAGPFEAGAINEANFGGATTGLFGVDAATNGENLITTYLFRTEINFAQTVNSVDGMALCDDACIFYIDGVEVGRLGPALAAPATTLTEAAGAGNEDTLTAVNFDTSAFGVGTHTLAVELHQTNRTSSDAGFALSLNLPSTLPEVLLNDNLAGQVGALNATADDTALDSVTGQPAGTVVMNSDGSFTFTPALNYNGTARFNYTIDDASFNPSTAQVTIVVEPVNDAPNANDDTYVTGTGGTIQTVLEFSTDDAIIPVGDDWWYSDVGEDLEGVQVNWWQAGFNPATEPFFFSGPAPAEFGFGEGDEATVVNDVDPFLQLAISAWYYQQTFSLDDPNIDTLHLNLKYDDGIAVFINGIEVVRDNMPGQAGDPRLFFTDLASQAAPDDGDNFHYFPIDTAGLNLQANGNTIAIEVHQNSLTSSDTSFDAHLSDMQESPGVLANDSDPDDAMTAVLLDATAADAVGTLTFNADGTFTFVPDDPNFNGRVTFTYQAQAGGQTDTATVTLDIGVIDLPPTAVDDNYTVEQGQVLMTDADPPPPSLIIDRGSDWEFLDRVENELGANHNYPVDGMGRAWNDPNFNTSTSTIGPWQSGIAPFDAGGVDAFAGQATTPLFGIDGAPDGTSNIITTYLFLKDFNLPTPVDSMSGMAACDDGCIFYIDGVQVLEFGTVPAPVTTTTLAGTTNGPTGTEEYSAFTIDTSFLAAGNHTFAVELHQTNLTSSDAGFDLDLSAVLAVPGLLENDTDDVDTNDELQVIAILNGPNNGVLNDWNADGSFTYTAAADFIGTDTFDYQVQDTWGNVSTATATITVTGNSPPVAVDDLYTIEQGETLTTVAMLDPPVVIFPFDATWDYLDTIENDLGLNQDYPIDGTGNAWNDPNFDVGTSTIAPWQSGQGPFEGGAINVFAGMVTTPLAGIDAAPDGTSNISTTYLFRTTLNLDQAYATLDAQVQCDDGCIFYLDGAEFYRLGTFADDPVTTLSFSTDTGEDAFTMVTFDTSGLTPGVDYTLAVEVHQPNTTSSDVGFGFQLEGPAPPVVLGMLANDSDPDGRPISVIGVQNGPDNGVLNWNADGSFTYTPNAGFTGTDSFEYQVEDFDGAVSTATVTIEVLGSVADDHYVIGAGQTLTTVPYEPLPAPTEVLSQGSTWDFLDTLENENGSSQSYPIDNEGDLWNTPDFDASSWSTGQGPFQSGGINAFTGATTPLFGIDAAPNGTDNLVTTYLFRTTFTLTQPALGLNANAVCDDACIFYIDGIEVGRLGTFDDDPVTTLTQAGDGNEDTFTTVALDTGYMAPGTYTLAVELHQTNLTSSDAGFEMSLNATMANFSVLANDPDRDDLTVTGTINGPSNGTVEIQADGTFTYTPNGGFTGTDSFDYQAQLAGGGTHTATVTIDVVTAQNPDAVDDTYNINQGDVLAAGFEPVVVVPFGSTWNYNDRLENQLGADHTYPVDGVGVAWNEPGFDIATSSVTGWAVGDGPFEAGTINEASFGGTTTPLFGIDEVGDENIITTYLFTTTFNLSAAAPTMLANALCDDVCIFYIDGVEVGRLGSIPDPFDTNTLASADGNEDAFTTVTFDTSSLAPGDHTLAVELHQTSLTSSDAGFELELSAVQAPNSPPGLLANDTDPLGGELTTELVTGPTNGTVEVNADGSFTYTPSAGFTGQDSFTYRAENGGGLTDTATVTININAPPVVQDETYSVDQDGILHVPSEFFPINTVWDFVDTLENGVDGVTDDYPVDGGGLAWNDPDFDTSTSNVAWSTGAGPFEGGTINAFNGMTTTALGGIDAAADGTTNLVTTYLFRTTVTLPAGVTSINSLVQCDDGCIFYLDGIEIGRLGTIADPVTTTSFSSDTGEDVFTNIVLDVTGVPAGEHTLAVEVHQANTTSSDVGFGMWMADAAVPQGVLVNDSDSDGGTLSLSLSSGPSNGAVTLNPDGTFIYTPDAAFTGTDTFQYQVADGQGGVSTGTVTINVGDTGAQPPQVATIELNAGIAHPPARPGTNLPLADDNTPIGWHNQKADILNIVITFDQPVNAAPGDFVLTNQGLNADVDPDQVISLDPEQVIVNGNTVTLSFHGTDPQGVIANTFKLPNGVYQLEILSSLTNQAGQGLDGNGDGTAGDSYLLTADSNNGFYRLDGEFNGDLGTSIFDFNVFSYWFGFPVGTGAGTAPAYMDLNRDDGVSIFDFNLFSAAFGRGISYPTPLVGALNLSDQVVTDSADDTDESSADQQQVVRDRAFVDWQPHQLERSEDRVADRDDAEEKDDLMDLLADDVAQIWMR